MRDLLLFFCILFPAITGILAYCNKGKEAPQRLLVVATGGVLVVASLGLGLFGSPTTLNMGKGLASLLGSPIVFLDFALLLLILYIGYKENHKLIMVLGAIQLAGLFILKFFMTPVTTADSPAFRIDSLAITLVLVVSIIGPVIARYALDYMKTHEEHLHLTQSKNGKFFAIILIFLGAMNGLALADDLSWVFFFWEVTTLCSYLLISHDGTEVAKNNACRALWMNMAGGVAFVFALIVLQQSAGTLSLTEIAALQNAGGIQPALLLVPVVALCFAGFTKSAQLPFQSWLCGAMVAPTPVSALLHSSTMVKAGVYLIIRLAPLYAGTSVSSMVAVFGAFTFIAAAALACGQSNGKKILAYSTISNLGLIVACAGINTKASIAAAMMLLVFHAVSKGLLFLCVGHIEQKIGSRDIEDMRGLFKTLPKTALVTVLGIVSMMLPPFGMLLAKWMALESAVEAGLAMPFIVTMLALGSGLTVLFWGRWAGMLLGSASPVVKIGYEEMPREVHFSFKYLAYGILGLSLLAPIVYLWLVAPVVSEVAGSAELAYTATLTGLANSYGVFAVYPIYFLIGGGCWYAWHEAKKHATPEGACEPYMSGIQATEEDESGFTGPMRTFVKSKASNYYLETFFGEDRISGRANTIALILLAMLVGGILQ